MKEDLDSKIKSSQEKPARRKAASPEKKTGKHRSHRAASGPAATTIKLGHSLRTGGSYVMKVSRKAYRDFNDYTMGDGAGSKKHKKSRSLKGCAFVLFISVLILVGIIGWIFLRGSSISVARQTVSVVGLPEELEGYKILLVSDLHGREFGTKQASLTRSINGESYNMVVFAGDMIGKSGNAQPFYDLLDGMSANRPTFFIAGDSDPDPVLNSPRDITGTMDEMVLADWVRGAQQRGATFLTATTHINVGNCKIWLTPVSQMSIDIQSTLRELKDEVAEETEGTLEGLDADRNDLPLTSWRLRQMQKLDEAVRAINTEDTHIAVSHYPPSKEYIDITQTLGAEQEEPYTYLPAVDLVLAGHYCGGGWKFPIGGAIYVPDTTLPRHGWFPDQSFVQGLRPLSNTQLYTTSGLANTDKLPIKFRFFNDPTVTILTLTSAITDDLLGG